MAQNDKDISVLLTSYFENLSGKLDDVNSELSDISNLLYKSDNSVLVRIQKNESKLAMIERNQESIVKLKWIIISGVVAGVIATAFSQFEVRTKKASSSAGIYSTSHKKESTLNYLHQQHRRV